MSKSIFDKLFCGCCSDSKAQKTYLNPDGKMTQSSANRKKGAAPMLIQEKNSIMEQEGNDEFWSDVSQFDTDTEYNDIDVTDEMFTLDVPGSTKYLVDRDVMMEVLKHVDNDVHELFWKYGPFKYRKADWNYLKLDKAKLSALKEPSDYYGQVRKGTQIREGRGVCVLKDGSLYEGFWKHGRQHGKGRLICTNQSIFQGDWKNGLKHGLGIYINHESGGMRKCHYKHGKEHGEGIEKWPDGTTYRGHFEDGSKHGYGTFKWADGSTYEGEIKEDLLEGFGTLKCSDGRIYEGNFHKSVMEGEGTFTWPDGKKYIGRYKGGKKHGKGKYKFPDGEEYYGDWVDGKPHGEVQHKDKKGHKHTHKVENGKFTKQITKLF